MHVTDARYREIFGIIPSYYKKYFYQYTQYYKKPKLVRPSLIWIGSKE